jgi:hypothetical protein
MSYPELLSGERADGSEPLLRWGRGRHRQHDFVDQLGLTRFGMLVTGAAILTNSQLEVPARLKRPLYIRAGDPFALVHLDLEPPPSG